MTAPYVSLSFRELSPRSEDTDLSPCGSHPVTRDFLLTIPLSVLNSVNVWLRNSWKFCNLCSGVSNSKIVPHPGKSSDI